MPLSEADTRSKLIDPAIHTCGWSEDMICRETTLGAVEIIAGKARRRSAGRTDYTLRIRVSAEAQPVAVALLEAKKDTLPPGHGLDQVKGYLAASRHNVQFVFSSNGHLFVEFDRSTGMTSAPRPLSELPSPADLRSRYERIIEEEGGRHHAKNARVHIATYQTLGIDREDGDPSFLFRHDPEDYFSHIVIDECHRSVWGKWSIVLTRNANAVQIGLTATPRQLACDEDTKEARADAEVTADNLKYFGEPVYEYGLAQAMEDGYLAACEIQLAQVNLDATGVTLADIVARNPRNANTGQPLTAAEIAAAYERTDFETKLLLPDRVNATCLDLFTRLLASDGERGPHQKTIIFCARHRHADDVAVGMNNLYAQWWASKGVARNSTARRAKAAADARPFKETTRAKSQEAERSRDRLAELKKAKPRDDAAIADIDSTIARLQKEAREATNKADDIENTVYDLKAVNPQRKVEADRRTPTELLDLIEAKGREVAEALKNLRRLTNP